MQRLVNECHGNRSFADRRGHALEVSAAHVADREDARKARFEEVRRPDKRPPRDGEIVVRAREGRPVSRFNSPLK